VRDFPTSFFSSKVTTLDPDSYLKFFEFGLKFVELLELKFDSLMHHAAAGKTSPLHYTAGSQISLSAA
jgi:hypothetical protein